MDPGHKASKNPFNNADLGFQAVGPALRIIMQLNVEGFSAAKCHIIQSLAEIDHAHEKKNGLSRPRSKRHARSARALAAIRYLITMS